ncbi:MAG: minor capsid protein [Alphaproteobacteria bacterium]|nr:minor capsid protein [Alphaproteobacteria bacterium]
MTSILVPLADYLDSEGLATPGVDLFIAHKPSDVNEGILLREYDGSSDPELTGLYRTGFQGVFRSVAYETGVALAMQIATALTIRQKALGQVWVYECYPRSVPIPVGREASGVETFVVNFDATWRLL